MLNIVENIKFSLKLKVFFLSTKNLCFITSLLLVKLLMDCLVVFMKGFLILTLPSYTFDCLLFYLV